MAARIRKIRCDENTRAKIQAANLITRMMKCVKGEIEMSQVQFSCAKALLAKVLPDLSQVQASVESTVTVRDLTDEELNAEIADLQAAATHLTH